MLLTDFYGWSRRKNKFVLSHVRTRRLRLGVIAPLFNNRNGSSLSAALNLNFADGLDTLDPRVTFSRSTSAMVTDAKGLLTWAPNNLCPFNSTSMTGAGANVENV